MAASDELKDIASSPAFMILEQLLKTDKLTQADAAVYRKSYSQLHSAVLQTYTNETILLQKTKQMKLLLENEQASYEKRSKAAQASHLETEKLETEDKKLHDLLDELHDKNEAEKKNLESLLIKVMFCTKCIFFLFILF